MASPCSQENPYDYIIVGAGTAGCIVAARLTEDPGIRVLLLEAGSSDVNDFRVKSPGHVIRTRGSEIDWSYKTVPQKYSMKGYADNVCVWPRGKVLGGSSSINGMCWVRGHHSDYDSWERQGCTGWGWKHVEGYFKKAENFITKQPVRSSTRCAVDITTHPFHRTEPSQAFIQAGVELGHAEVDINCGQNIGFGPFPAAIDYNGERSSSATGYLRKVIGRDNLKVLTKVHVTKLTFEGNAVKGVVVLQGGGRTNYTANKEVIICAGSINSPQLLMLSGIGPKEHLADIGIDCIVDLPVGKNLQDHLQLQLKVDVKPGSDVYTCEKIKTDTNTSETTAFIRSPLETMTEWPDYQLGTRPMFYLFGVLALKMFPVKDLRFLRYMGFDRTIGDFVRREGFIFQVIQCHPRSIGEIRLKNADPLSHPIIDPRYLEDKKDVDVMIEGIRLTKKITETEAMRPFDMKFVNLSVPGNVHSEWSDENLEDLVRHFAWTIFHPVGTCKMGGNSDKTAVVDPELRVRGIRKLRVIDASIMPHLTSGNTVAPTSMIGEKGADLIKRDLYINSSKL